MLLQGRRAAQAARALSRKCAWTVEGVSRARPVTSILSMSRNMHVAFFSLVWRGVKLNHKNLCNYLHSIVLLPWYAYSTTATPCLLMVDLNKESERRAYRGGAPEHVVGGLLGVLVAQEVGLVVPGEVPHRAHVVKDK